MPKTSEYFLKDCSKLDMSSAGMSVDSSADSSADSSLSEVRKGVAEAPYHLCEPTRVSTFVHIVF